MLYRDNLPSFNTFTGTYRHQARRECRRPHSVKKLIKSVPNQSWIPCTKIDVTNKDATLIKNILYRILRNSSVEIYRVKWKNRSYEPMDGNWVHLIEWLNWVQLFFCAALKVFIIEFVYAFLETSNRFEISIAWVKRLSSHSNLKAWFTVPDCRFLSIHCLK